MVTASAARCHGATRAHGARQAVAGRMVRESFARSRGATYRDHKRTAGRDRALQSAWLGQALQGIGVRYKSIVLIDVSVASWLMNIDEAISWE